MKTQLSELQKTYNAVTFTLASGIMDYDVKNNIPESFKNLNAVSKIYLITNFSISFRVNKDDNPIIPITSSLSPFEFPGGYAGMNIENIFITNMSGDTATITLIGVY